MTRAVLAVLALSAFGCAPTIFVRRERPPAITVPGRTISIQAHTRATGSAFLDLLRVLSGSSIDDERSQYAARTVEEVVVGAQAGYAVLSQCPAPCPTADAIVIARVENASTQVSSSSTKKETKYDGSADVLITVVRRDHTVAFQRKYHGTSTGTGDVLSAAIRNGARDAGNALLPRWTSDAFVLAKEGPLKDAALLASKGQLDEAEQLLRAYIAQTPAEPFGHFHLGAVLTARGQLEAALVEFQAAAQGSGDYADEVADAQGRLNDRDALRAFRGQ